jgi:DNA-binding MarR family transcriptional regulator
MGETKLGPTANLLHLLAHTQHCVTSLVAAALREQQSSIEEWRVLSLLADRAGHSMSEIADYALMPAPTTTKLIDRMVSSNLVHRRVDPTDRRRVLVFLTPRGRNAYRRLCTVIDSSIASLDKTPLRELAQELQRYMGTEPLPA